MAQFRIPNRDQLLMFGTIDLNSIAPIGSVVHIIDVIVDRLDLSDIEKEYDIIDPMGRPPFHPKTIIKVCLLALYSCRFSTRKMEEDTKFNLLYKFLTGNEVIDHSTFGKFLSKYKEQIIELFAQVIQICMEKELVNFDILAIDTEKIKADASYKQSKTKSSIKKEREKIRKRILELVEKADDESEIEKEILKEREAKLENAQKVPDARLKEKSAGKSEKEKEKLEKKEKVNITDPDATIMSQANGECNPMYAVTTATDGEKDIITNFEVRGENNDSKVLLPTIEGSEEITGERSKKILADSGFSSFDNYENLEQEKIDGYIPDRRKEAEDMNTTSKGEYDRSNFEYNKKKDIYKCPEGAILENTGRFKGTDGRDKIIYSNSKACQGCPAKDKCTKAKNGGRKIIRDANEEVQERMREKLDSDKGKEIYNMRAHPAESPYGNMKHNHKFRNFMRRGIVKVTMECALVFMLHNIIKIASVIASG